MHLRVITPVTTTWFRKEEDFRSFETADTRITHRCLHNGPPSIESEFDEAFAVPELIERIVEAEKEGCDAVIVDCMGDPGVRAAREAVRIPTVGPSEASMHLATLLGHRFSVVTVLESVRGIFVNSACLAGLEQRLASVRVVDIPVLELEADIPRLHAALSREAIAAVQADRADVIIFGCTGMLGCTQAVRTALLERGMDVPVIDPVPAAINLASALVRAGLSHSKLRYPTPPIRDFAGFASIASARRGTSV